MAKNFGPNTNTYLDPTGRNWETVVFQRGVPVLDKELVLSSEVGGSLRGVVPSGWVSSTFLSESGLGSDVFQPVTTPNTLRMGALKAVVNGWVLDILHTGTEDYNDIDLGAGPSGAGSKRTDLVILEVWRRLISAAPSTDGKSPLGRIWQNGNVKTDSSEDATLNFADDIYDANVGKETTRRVQIQYRLRVIQDVDVFANPMGMGDAAVEARTVPPDGNTPDGDVYVGPDATYAKHGEDPGLWVAGDGDPENGLGTVDGYMYAIPLVAVFRRNTDAFDQDTNNNGGVAYSVGTSDRPDGLFHDIIAERDVVDLRHGISTTGWDYAEVLEKNFHALLDNYLQTEWTSTSPQGGGNDGATVLWADEIGPSDTAGAELIGDFDGVRRSFSDRAVSELMTVVVDAPPGGWVDGSEVTVDPTSLAVYPHAAYNWASLAPSDTVIVDAVNAWFAGGSGKVSRKAIVRVTGLGELPMTSLTVEVVAAVDVTDEPLYLTLLVSYPLGNGLTKTPVEDFGADSVVINDDTALDVGSPIYFDSIQSSLDHTHREVRIEYGTSEMTWDVACPDPTTFSTFPLPEWVDAETVSVTVNGNTTTENVVDGLEVEIPAGAQEGDLLTVEYTAVRPIPPTVQATVFYNARAPQTVRNGIIGTELAVTPRYISPHVYVVATGSGSQDEGFPHPFAYVQTGGIYPSALGSFAGEHELDGRASIAVSDFEADTGFLRLPALIGYAPKADAVIFNRAGTDIDIEGRTYFKAMDATVKYGPNVRASQLSHAKKHKVLVPMLAELREDTLLGPRGQLVMILVTRWAEFDAKNEVMLVDDLNDNTTAASVFRVKGNLLNRSLV